MMRNVLLLAATLLLPLLPVGVFICIRPSVAGSLGFLALYEIVRIASLVFFLKLQEE